jgi:hypothetical protein
MLEHMEDEIEKFKKTEEGKDFWGARMIWTTIRAFNKKQVVESTLPHTHILTTSRPFTCAPNTSPHSHQV